MTLTTADASWYLRVRWGWEWTARVDNSHYYRAPSNQEDRG